MLLFAFDVKSVWVLICAGLSFLTVLCFVCPIKIGVYVAWVFYNFIDHFVFVWTLINFLHFCLQPHLLPLAQASFKFDATVNATTFQLPTVCALGSCCQM
jgi:hypothetical protein